MSAAQLVFSVLTLIASAGAAFWAYRSATAATKQRETQGRREEWWRRFAFATELALDADQRRSNIGVLLVMRMSESSLASDDEWAAADVVIDQVLAPITDRDA